MPAFNPGTGADAVVLKLNGHPVSIFTSYTVRKSILTQPSQFNVRLGYGQIGPTGQTLKDLLKLVPPNTPFQLYINNLLQQTGVTDGYEVNGFASEVEIHGRDAMARIHDAYLTADIGFKNATYTSLTESAMKQLGITAPLVHSNQANRKLTAGVNIPEISEPTTIDQVDVISSTPGNISVKRSITAKLGETYFNFLQRQYRRAGIFLWAAGDGSFVLQEPNSQQSPIYRIVRQRGQTRNAVNVISHRWKNDITNRYTTATAYGRGGGRVFGRQKTGGTFVDDEMSHLLGGDDKKPITYRDVNVSNRSQAEYYARRKIAEFNRASWQLQYTVVGHTTPNIQTGQLAVWQPDTMVEVIDDELGLKGSTDDSTPPTPRLFYIEEVVFTRPPTTTTLTLMRPQDLIFASDE